jgi:hypothetical protein
VVWWTRLKRLPLTRSGPVIAQVGKSRQLPGLRSEAGRVYSRICVVQGETRRLTQRPFTNRIAGPLGEIAASKNYYDSLC